MPARRPSRSANGRDLVTRSAPTKMPTAIRRLPSRTQPIDGVEPDAGQQQHAEQWRSPSDDVEDQHVARAAGDRPFDVDAHERITATRNTASDVGGAIIDIRVEPWSDAAARNTESPSMKKTNGSALRTWRSITSATRSVSCQTWRCSMPPRTASQSMAPTRSMMTRAQNSDRTNKPTRRSQVTRRDLIGPGRPTSEVDGVTNERARHAAPTARATSGISATTRVGPRTLPAPL